MNDNGRIMKELKELTEAMKNVTNLLALIFTENTHECRGQNRWRQYTPLERQDFWTGKL